MSIEETGDVTGTEEYNYKAQGFGLAFSTGGSYRISGPLYVFAEGGYRHFRTGHLKDEDGRAWEIRYTRPYHKMDLDYSGFFVLGGLSLRI